MPLNVACVFIPFPTPARHTRLLLINHPTEISSKTNPPATTFDDIFTFSISIFAFRGVTFPFLLLISSFISINVKVAMQALHRPFPVLGSAMLFFSFLLLMFPIRIVYMQRAVRWD